MAASATKFGAAARAPTRPDGPQRSALPLFRPTLAGDDPVRLPLPRRTRTCIMRG